MTYDEIMAMPWSPDKTGRAQIFLPGHPLTEGRRVQVLRNRLVMWEVFGPFDLSFVVHHKDEDKTNDHPSNLELLSRAEHTAQHSIGNRFGEKNRGVPKSEEHRRKLSEAHLRRGQTEAQIAAAARRRGTRWTDEQRARLSEMRRGKKHPGSCMICGLPYANTRTHQTHAAKIFSMYYVMPPVAA